MDRMSMMDASFLFSEDGRSHNDVGMVLVFEGPAPSRQEIMQVIADRLALVPRFRQRLRHMPFGLGLPVWVDDVSFEMERHVKVRMSKSLARTSTRTLKASCSPMELGWRFSGR